MTMHAMALPGYQAHSVLCGSCPANLGHVSTTMMPLLMHEWQKALRAGPAAIDAYLAEHNAGVVDRHDENCPFRELPPVVHASHRTWDDLVRARHALDAARAGES
ncbi:hypothetical protein [Streptomyces sp. 4F14]|uniref:hypothetical protein n=1 Tax=Streptomyces sp. 4F14 TaxID=3394380 RepID=UPI003A844B35